MLRPSFNVPWLYIVVNRVIGLVLTRCFPLYLKFQQLKAGHPIREHFLESCIAKKQNLRIKLVPSNRSNT